MAINLLYSFAWKHFDKLRNIIQFDYFSYFNKRIELSTELQENIGINKDNTTVHLKDFIKNTENIQKQLDENELFHEQIGYLNQNLELFQVA